jgi:hypothetical protein
MVGRKFEEILAGLKFMVLAGKKEPTTIEIHMDDLVVIGSKAMEEAFSKCELTPEYGVSCFNARDRGDFGKMVVEYLFDNKISCVSSFNGTLRGFAHCTYKDFSEFRFKI